MATKHQYAADQHTLLTSGDIAIDAILTHITMPSPAELPGFLARVKQSLAHELKPFRHEEAAYACYLLAKVFGGDAATYLKRWTHPA